MTKRKLQQTKVRDFFDNLDAKQRKEFVKNVGVLSGLKSHQIYYRLRNNSWSVPELALINQILSGFGLMVFYPGSFQPTVCFNHPIKEDEDEEDDEQKS